MSVRWQWQLRCTRGKGAPTISASRREDGHWETKSSIIQSVIPVGNQTFAPGCFCTAVAVRAAEPNAAAPSYEIIRSAPGTPADSGTSSCGRHRPAARRPIAEHREGFLSVFGESEFGPSPEEQEHVAKLVWNVSKSWCCLFQTSGDWSPWEPSPLRRAHRCSEKAPRIAPALGNTRWGGFQSLPPTPLRWYRDNSQLFPQNTSNSTKKPPHI